MFKVNDQLVLFWFLLKLPFLLIQYCLSFCFLAFAYLGIEIERGLKALYRQWIILSKASYSVKNTHSNSQDGKHDNTSDLFCQKRLAESPVLAFQSRTESCVQALQHIISTSNSKSNSNSTNTSNSGNTSK